MMIPRRCILPFVAMAPMFLASYAAADDWPQWRGPKRDGIWRENGVVEKFDQTNLKHVWRADLGSGYTGPTVANGRVYVTDRLIEPKQVERVHCFDEKTGKSLWSHTYDCTYRDVGYEAGPRACVTIDDGRAYSLGTMGNLFCFDAAIGRIIWQNDLAEEYKIEMPVWGIACAPLIEGDLLILQIGGADGACLVALDKKTGAEKWRALNDKASYSAPIIIERDGRRILIVYTGEHVAGLDPQSGKVYWKYPFPPRRMVIGVASPVVEKDLIFLTNFFDGCLMLRMANGGLGAEKLWQRAGPDEIKTDGLHSIISTPIFKGGYVYGVDSYGKLKCLDAKNGEEVWGNYDAMPKARWATIHFVEHGEQVWMFTEKGDLVIAELSPKGYREISRTHLIDPTKDQLPSRRGGVCWSHPAFANRHIFQRNDKEIVCADLTAKQ